MLSPAYRLQRQADFAQVAKKGKKRHSNFFIFYIYKSKPEQKNPRFGIVISQKTSKLATKRNLLRRWIKSDLYKIKDKIPPFDYMLVVKNSAIGKTHQEISADLNKICY